MSNYKHGGFSCMMCKGFGAIVATERKTGYVFAYRCLCGAKPENNKCYPLWQDKFKYKYSPDFMDEPLPDHRQATADQTSVKKITQDAAPDYEEEGIPF